MRRLGQRAGLLQLVPHRRDASPSASATSTRPARRSSSRSSSTTTPRCGSTASCRSRSATRGGPVVGGFNAPNRVVLTRDARPGERFQIAVFGINGPISASPRNYIWMRTATLDFYARERAAVARPWPFELERSSDGSTTSSAPTRGSSGWPAASSSPRARCGARTARCCSARRTRTRSTAGTRRGEVTVFRSKSGYTGADIGRYHQPGSNGLTFDPEGRLTICQHGNRRVVRVEPHGDIDRARRPLRGQAAEQPNDLVYRSDGTLLFTDPPFGLPGVFDDPDKELPFSGVFARPRRRGDARHRRARGPERPRVLARRALPLRRQLGPGAQGRDALRARRRTALVERQVFFDMTDAPGEDAIDGIKVDETGNLYVCGPGGVWILSPDGRAPRPARAARGPAQPRVGRRRRPHALRHRADERLPDPPRHPGHPPDRPKERHDEQGPRARRDVCPTSSCPTRTATLHRLSDLQGDDAMVLMLGRGEHCPRERLHQREMVRFHEWCPVAFTSSSRSCPTTCTTSSSCGSRPARTGPSWPTRSSRSSRRSTSDEYTDPHHDHAGVPHTLILSPGLKIEKVYVGYWFWGRPSTVPAVGRPPGALCGASRRTSTRRTPEARAAWMQQNGRSLVEQA